MAESDRDAQGVRAARRRHITILFSDLSEFTALAGSVEPEYCLDVIDHLKLCTERVIPKYGGIVVGFRGDGVMAMFGYPEPSEYDGRRATEAALELHDAIRQMQASGAGPALPPLRLHTGVHSGLVLIIENDPSPGQYALVGEAPSVAARLSDIAAMDEILVSATTLGGESHFFDIRERGDLALHGKVKPVAVLQVLGHSPAHTRYQARTQTGLTPFVGRTRELDVLGHDLQDVINGSAREIAVVASAGLGKTRLVEQFLQRAGHLSVHVCRGYCENYLGAEPLQPFLQMLRQFAKQEDVSPASTLPRSADDAARALCELFAAPAGRKPVILFIDDWQWADDATKQVLARVRAMELRSLLILTASREPPPENTDRSKARVLHLTPFDQDETAETILKLRSDADPFVVRQIQQLSGGNPLFIEELCHWTSRESTRHEIEHGDNLPAWLSTLIESRVGRLPLQQAEVVRAAAVIGVVVPVWLLEQVTGHHEDDPIVRELAERDLIFPGEVEGTLRFKHGVTRDVIYASVGLRRRETLHRQIARLLERRSVDGSYEAVLEQLSYHFRAGAEPGRAAHYAELAGDKALAAAAPDRARSQYAAALVERERLPPSDDNYRRWSRIVHRLGLACVFGPARDQLALFNRAAELARERGDRSGMARAEYWLGFIHYALGDLSEAIGRYERARIYCAQALEAASTADDHEIAAEMNALGVQLLATIGQARAAAGEHDAALALLDEALAVKRQHRRSAHPAVGSAYTLACKGAVLGNVGRFAEAYACFDEALEAIRAGHPAVECSILGWRSAVCLWQGRWQEARESAMRAQSLAQRVESLYVLAMCQAVAGYASWMLERTPASIDATVRATSWLEVQDKRLSISMNYGWLADIMAAEARVPEARIYAARAIRRARARDAFGEPTAYRALASLPWRGRGRRPDEYLALAMRSALARRSPREQAVTWLHEGQHAARCGRRREAVQFLERARSAFTSMEMTWHDAAAERCLSELGAGQSLS